jgi:alkanesulfonate monooxygenase SsuD/methylene tetrahydromethanopterin reductase-like flavin-dependent oxidoreductase (luciferase family)
VALAAAAVRTDTIDLGTYVVNAGVREPWQVAVAAATVDRLSGGRFHLGIGAGHTPGSGSWPGAGPSLVASGSICLHEFVEVVARLLDGEAVTFTGEHFCCEAARIDSPRPVSRIPLTIGGNGRRVMRLAGQMADVVWMTGFVRTLADGHNHAVCWSLEDVAQRVADITGAASGRTQLPRIEVLVQHVEPTEDRRARAQGLVDSGIEGLDLDTALNTPFVLIGTPEEIAQQIHHWRERLAITSYVMRPDAINTAPLILHALQPNTLDGPRSLTGDLGSGEAAGERGDGCCSQ